MTRMLQRHVVLNFWPCGGLYAIPQGEGGGWLLSALSGGRNSEVSARRNSTVVGKMILRDSLSSVCWIGCSCSIFFKSEGIEPKKLRRVTYSALALCPFLHIPWFKYACFSYNTSFSLIMAFLTKFFLNSGFSATQITLLFQNASPVHNVGGVLFAL